MARRMLSLAALLSPRRWRSVPAVRCLRSTCNRWRVSYLSSLRSLCRAVQGQAELACCKATRNHGVCVGQPGVLDTRFDTVVHRTNSLHQLGAKNSGLESSNFELGRASSPPRPTSSAPPVRIDAFRNGIHRHHCRRVRPDTATAPQPQTSAARRGRAEPRHNRRLVRGRARWEGQGGAGQRAGEGVDDGAAALRE